MFHVATLAWLARAMERPTCDDDGADGAGEADEPLATATDTIAPPPGVFFGASDIPPPPGLSAADYADVFQGYVCIAVPLRDDGSLPEGLSMPPWSVMLTPAMLPCPPCLPYQQLPTEPTAAAESDGNAAWRGWCMRGSGGRRGGEETGRQPQRRPRKPREPSPPRAVVGLAHKARQPWVPKVQREHREEEERRTTCAICLSGSEVRLSYVALNACGHNFHQDCWDQLQRQAAANVRTRCPVCKKVHGNKTSRWVAKQ